MHPSLPLHRLVSAMRKLLVVLALFVGYWVVNAGQSLMEVIYSYARGFREEELVHLQDLRRNRSLEVGFMAENNTLLKPREQSRIPKILHRTWKNTNLSTVPNPKWIECFTYCQEKHPKWTIILWTDETGREMVRQSYPWFLHDYDSYQFPIQRVDSLRYFLLHKYGGVYMDMDISCRRTLDELVDAVPPDTVLLPITTPLGLSQDVLLAPANHPFFTQLIHSLSAANRWYGSPYPTVFFSTGPSFVTRQYLFGPREATKNVKIMANDVLEGLDQKQEQAGGFFKHVKGSSWHSTDAKIVSGLADFATAMLWVIAGCSQVCVVSLIVYRCRRRRRRCGR